MKRLRPKLTYANAVATLALVLVVGGGSAYAAGHLAKESVGARQLRKGAVTPVKLSKSTKRTLAGQVGPAGPVGPRGVDGSRGVEGARGVEGPPGLTGSQGPGATSISQVIPEDMAAHVVGTFAGVVIEAACNSAASTLELKSPGGVHTIDLYGTYSFGGNVSSVSVHEESGYAIESTGGAREAFVDVIARDTAVGPSFSEVRLHLGGHGQCEVDGMVTPAGT
jgi:hypothetical protein